MDNKSKIETMYTIYLKNTIVLASESEILNKDVLEINVTDYVGDIKKSKNSYINTGYNLSDNILKNGTYWLISIYGPKHFLHVMEGKNRVSSFKKNNISLVLPMIYIQELGYKNPILIQYYDENNDIQSQLCKSYNQIFHYTMPHIEQTTKLMYKYYKDTGKDYTTSLLCNDYNCLIGAVKHYKDTGKFITDNNELQKKFVIQ